MYKAVAFCPKYDTPGKRDASRAFIPETVAFNKLWGGYYQEIDNKKPQIERKKSILYFKRKDIDLVAFFCHGWKTGIQLGFNNNNVGELADYLVNIASGDDLIVALYCCSVADGGQDGEGGFADKLRDALCKRGCINARVTGHYTAGHTTHNPYVRVFAGEGSKYGGTGGYRLVSPKSVLWGPWKRALKTDFRLRFPTMPISEIHEELEEWFI